VETQTEVLTRLGLCRKAEDITDAAYAAAKKMLLDALGCALAARNAPGVPEVVEQMRAWGGAPQATVLVEGCAVPAPNAIFANSTMVHAMDYDDIHMPGTLHITSVIVPSMLAAAEMSGASGRDALAATIMGIEVAGRLGTVSRERRRSGAFLPSSLVGGFGAVVTDARLLGLSTKQCVDAMGINYAQTSGTRQALHDMTLTKRVQPAFAARSAMWAVELARRGITGPARALEGESGYWKAYMNGDVPGDDEFAVEKPWYEVENVGVKRHTSCGGCHSAQDAAERLVAEEKLTPDQIERVELFGFRPGGLVSGPFNVGENPQVDAQFSVAYAVALTLLRGPAGLEQFTDEAVRADREVAELAAAITYVERPDSVPAELIEAPNDYPPHTTRPHGVIVHTTDGRPLVRYRCPAQTFDARRMGFEDVAAKVRACARFSRGFDEAGAAAIIEAVRTLDEAPDVSGLIASCVRTAGARR
jgi:2-methylcitrate dehydratase PrpD